MRKILYLIICIIPLMSFTHKANAQTWTIGGGLTMKTTADYFYTRSVIDGGYEFNDKWAVGLKTGFEGGDNNGAIIFGSNVRFTPWHNDIVYLDVKAVAESLLYEDTFISAGIVPSLRFRVAPKWEVYSNFGFVGFRGDVETPAAILTSSDAELGVTFRF